METNPSITSANPESKITGLLQKFPVVLQLCRFAAIGFLNTALSFVISNLLSKFFGIEQGGRLGLVSGIGFIFATTQSYFWNKDWAFGKQADNLLKNFLHLVWVGCAGVLTLALVLLGSKAMAPYYYYFIVLVVFFVAQFVLWKSFGLSAADGDAAAKNKNPFLAFFIVSFIGFVINFLIVSQFSSAVHLTANADLNKNIAFIVATAVSLIWNFIGYKVVVFRR